MTRVSQLDAAGMLMALTQGVATWVAVVPDVRHVQNKTVDDGVFLEDFRRTEMTASAITLGVGALGSVFLKSIYPFLASVLIVALLVSAYEVSLRAVPSNQT